MSQFESPKELVEMMFDGYQPTAVDLNTLRKESWREGVHHDFKSGSMLGRRATKKANREVKKANREVRRYVAAFANSDGGLLVIGVGEPAGQQGPRPLEPSLLPEAATWAREVTAQLGPYLSPPLRLALVKIAGGEAILIAVQRAPQLVPVAVPDGVVFCFRHCDGTFDAPGYLLGDLIQGRRQHPVLEVKAEGVSYEAGGSHRSFLLLQYYLEIENVGLVEAEEIAVAAVVWTFAEGNAKGINRHLRSYVDGEVPPDRDQPGTWIMKRGELQSKGQGATLKPFTSILFKGGGHRVPVTKASADVRVAMYVLPKSSPPLWFQLECSIPPGLGIGVDGIEHGRLEGPILLRRTHSQRPRVEWKEEIENDSDA